METMTQEQKDLLLKDLCGRLPYKIRAQFPDNYGGYTSIIEDIDIDGFVKDFEGSQWDIADIKPYLLPLSSMTAEQLFEVQSILGSSQVKIENDFIDIVDSRIRAFSYEELDALFNWFYENHFDFRGLIKKGLALDATNLNIY